MDLTSYIYNPYIHNYGITLANIHNSTYRQTIGFVSVDDMYDGFLDTLIHDLILDPCPEQPDRDYTDKDWILINTINLPKLDLMASFQDLLIMFDVVSSEKHSVDVINAAFKLYGYSYYNYMQLYLTTLTNDSYVYAHWLYEYIVSNSKYIKPDDDGYNLSNFVNVDKMLDYWNDNVVDKVVLDNNLYLFWK